MTVALLAKGIDAFSGWDPWPIIALKDVPGAVEVIRGGDVISYLGFNVALRPWVEKNGDKIEKFLAALSEADKWMRANPKQAAQVATRWIPRSEERRVGKECRSRWSPYPSTNT